jgi:hypothetical protein
MPKHYVLKRPRSPITRKSLQIKGFTTKVEYDSEKQGLADYNWLNGHAQLASDYLFVRKKPMGMSDLNDDVDDIGRSLG